MTEPLLAGAVAVIIPCHAQAHFLGEAVASALAQEPRPAEVVVVDDGSPDDVQGALEPFGDVHLVRQPNAGLSAARNAGVAATGSPYLVFLDADDRLLPGALRSGLACLQANPRAAFAWGGYRNVDSSARPLGRNVVPRTHRDAFSALLRGNVIGMHGTVMYRRAALVAAGGFDETLRACEDYDIYLRLTRHHRAVSHPVVIAEYRRHDAGMSRDYARLIDAGLQVLRRHTPRAGDPAAWSAAHRSGVRWLVALNLKRALMQGLRSLGRGDGTALRTALRAMRLYAPLLLGQDRKPMNTRYCP